MQTLKMMIGLPRCGKSTWVQKHKTNEVVISADDMRYLVYNQRYWGEGESLMWSIRGMFLKYLMQQGVDIIIDETNTTAERRKPILKLAKQYGYKVIGCVVEGSWVDECVKRAEETGQADLIPIIHKMAEQWEGPLFEEGFAEINMV